MPAASIFGEMIVYRDLLEMSKTPEERLTQLMSKIDDVVNSVVRQCSFDFFEFHAHSARENGELTSDELDGFWKQAIETYYGIAQEEGGDSPFDSYENTEHLWSYGEYCCGNDGLPLVRFVSHQPYVLRSAAFSCMYAILLSLT